MTKEGPLLVPDHHLAIVAFPAAALAEAEGVYDEACLVGMRRGLLALRTANPHLGCRVVFCPSSGWWEDPCDGTQFNAVGEKRDGPAPRGLDRWPIVLPDGDRRQLVVDTRVAAVQGTPLGTDTTGQRHGGPHCP